MIIKMLLEELFAQLRDVLEYENIQIYKIVDSMEVRHYYSSENNEKSNYDLNKIMDNMNSDKYILEIIKSNEEMFLENIQYNFKDQDKDSLVCFIPLLFEGQAIFCISMLIDNKDFNLIEEKKQEILEIIDSFNEVFCFDEMIKIDMIRDRVSATF